MKYKVGDLVKYYDGHGRFVGIGVIYRYDPHQVDGPFAVWWTNHCTKTDAKWYDKKELRAVNYESR